MPNCASVELEYTPLSTGRPRPPTLQHPGLQLFVFAQCCSSLQGVSDGLVLSDTGSLEARQSDQASAHYPTQTPGIREDASCRGLSRCNAYPGTWSTLITSA